MLISSTHFTDTSSIPNLNAKSKKEKSLRLSVAAKNSVGLDGSSCHVLLLLFATYGTSFRSSCHYFHGLSLAFPQALIGMNVQHDANQEPVPKALGQ
jgi:hypothetical protein